MGTWFLSLFESILSLIDKYGIQNVLIVVLLFVLIYYSKSLIKKQGVDFKSMLGLHATFQDKLIELQEKRIKDIKELSKEYHNLCGDIEASLLMMNDCLAQIVTAVNTSCKGDVIAPKKEMKPNDANSR